MKLKIPKLKFSFALISLKYIYIIIILIILGFGAALGYFFYSYYYQTIAQSQEVVLLRQEVAPDTIDISRVEKVLDALDKKTTTSPEINFKAVKNPFSATLPQIETESTVSENIE